LDELEIALLTGTDKSPRGGVDHTDALPVLLTGTVDDIPDGHVLLAVFEKYVGDGLLSILFENGIASMLLCHLECLVGIGFDQQRQKREISGVGVVAACIRFG
jgi:hypothetical protein